MSDLRKPLLNEKFVCISEFNGASPKELVTIECYDTFLEIREAKQATESEEHYAVDIPVYISIKQRNGHYKARWMALSYPERLNEFWSRMICQKHFDLASY